MKILKTVFPLLAVALICFTSLFPSCGVSTANLSNVKLCSSSDGNPCGDDLSKFNADVQVINCTASLNNAPAKTKVSFVWKQESETVGTAEVEAESGYISSTFKPKETLPAGNYSVTVKIATDNSQPITKNFTVE
ncbi:MAG: hypothetical protein LWX07_06055 [Bacteroidetes bacterium]|nr:hypothetical protein [Bacteroidota bacterium]